MNKVLIAYYPLGETEKVAKKMSEVLLKNNFEVDIEVISLQQEMSIKEQFKKEKILSVNSKISSLSKYSSIIIGTPIVSFTSVPAVNAFIRSLPELGQIKCVFFATSIGLPGKAIKKMSSIVSMKNGIVVEGKVFSSIFEFDSRKLREVEIFVEKIKDKL
jgi:flavodoxin